MGTQGIAVGFSVGSVGSAAFVGRSAGVSGTGAEGTTEGSWLPDMDLNHDKQIQSLLCYRYTIGQSVGARR